MTVLRILLYSPDVILIGKDNDYSSIGVLTQPPDNLVKLSRSWFAWYFHWLGNAQTTWLGGKKNKQNKNNVSKCFIRRTCLRCNLTQILPLSSFNPYLFSIFWTFFFMINALLNVHWCNISRNEGCKALKKRFSLDKKKGILETGLTINSGYDSDSETRGQ